MIGAGAIKGSGRVALDACRPDDGERVCLVGHSFGGAVAMKAAAELGDRVEKLILLEPNPFYLLGQNGRQEAFAEIASLRDCIKQSGASGDWAVAAETFSDYWGAWVPGNPCRRSEG
jgi:pimeloyl-ACP methyl ester carboxylesterase